MNITIIGTGYGGSCFPKDVQALIRTGREHGQTLRMLEAVQGADALIIVTEWKAYRSPNWPAMKAAVIFDGRNLYEPRDIKSQGIEYHGIGRVVDAHR